MQDLSEMTAGLDLDGALQRTYQRHGELVRQRARRRRWAVGAGLAACLLAATVVLPMLGGDERGAPLKFAGPGMSSATSTSAPSATAPPAVPADEVAPGPAPSPVEPDTLTKEADLLILQREPASAGPVTTDASGSGLLGGAMVSNRIDTAEAVGPAPTGDGVVVRLGPCPGPGAGFTVRYRYTGGVLSVDGSLQTAFAGECAEDLVVTLPLDSPWDPAAKVVVGSLR